MKLSHLVSALVIVCATLATGGAASACEVVGYKNGERLCSTTYVYKDGRSKSWTDPSAYTKPAEKCRSACLRDAVKLGSSDQQTAYFNSCKKNKGCE